MDIIEETSTNREPRVHGNVVAPHEQVTWSIPGGSAVWTQGRWGRPEILVVDREQARARILLEMGGDLPASPTYKRYA